MPMPTSPLARLGAFRTELHACYTRRADALVELGDALLCAQTFPSLPHLSLEPVYQRGWGSVYAALASGRLQVERLRDLLVDCLPPADPLVFAVDVTCGCQLFDSCHATCAYSWISPPSRSRRATLPAAGMTGGSADPSGGACPKARCGRWPL